MLLNNNLKMFEEFLGDPKARLTGSDIARKKRLNQKTVSNLLKKLEDEGILKSKIEGKNKVYSLNLDNKQLAREFVLAAEHLRTVEFYKNNLIIKEIAEKIQPYISGIAVIFGSYAKSNQKEDSDLDVFIVGKCNEKEIEKISQRYNIEISIKIYPRNIFEKNITRDILIKEVINNHIIIKNAELFIDAVFDEQD